jgi:F1F0 ATPase subunit 2
MIDWLALALSLIVGIMLGLFYFGTLWVTVQKMSTSSRPVLLGAVSFIFRTVIAMVVLFIVTGGEIDRLLACLVGFIIARQILMWRFGPGKARSEG